MTTQAPQHNISGWDVLLDLANVALLLVSAVYVAGARYHPDQLRPLVLADKKLAARISHLEQMIEQQPNKQTAAAIELSRLYAKASELPWSVDTLKRAELYAASDPMRKLQIAMAYVDIGRNERARDILSDTVKMCQTILCSASVLSKIDIYTQLTKRLIERAINARTDPDEATRAYNEVVKTIKMEGPPPGESSPKETANRSH